MMKKPLFFLMLLCSVTSYSCEKEKEDDTKPTKEETSVAKPKEQIVEITTTYGSMYIWLYKDTPKHRDNFLKLTKEKFFDGTTFHRIIPNFMIQGGDPNSKDADPNNDGQGRPGYTIDAEIMSNHKNTRGTLAAARLGDNVNPQKASSGSQFYINVKNNAFLDNQYTVFGEVIKGLNVADSIVVQPRNNVDRPFTDIKMEVKVLQKTAAQLQKEFGFTVPE